MPIREVRRGKRKQLIGYQWGTSGKIYTIRRFKKKGAKERARRQGAAIKISQSRK